MPDDAAAATTTLDRVADEWLGRRGVVSVEVARRWRNGRPTDEVGIRVTVEQVLPADDVPEGELFPNEVDGVPVDIVEGRAPQIQTPESLADIRDDIHDGTDDGIERA